MLAFFTPAHGASPNAKRSTRLYKITLYIALVIFIAVEGALGYALVKFRKRKGAVAAQIHGNTRLEIGWTAGAAVILLGLAVLTFAKLSSIQDPPNSGPGGVLLGEQNNLIYASTERKLPPNGKALNITVIGRQYIWQFVYPGANEPDGLGAPYSYEELVVPTNTTVTPGHRLRGRRALLVGAGTRRQVPGGARLPQLHLVQGRQAGHLPRTVRVPVRARTRAHDRHREGRPAGPVRSVAGPPEAADRAGERRSGEGAHETGGADRRRSRSRTPRTSRRPAHEMATYAAPIPQISAHRAEREDARLDQLDHDDRSQADRDHVHGHDVRVLLPRRHRGADDPPAAGRAEQHAGDARNLQPAVHDARDDDGLPVRRADDGGARELLPAADDRRARHGLPAPERAVLLAAAGRRHRLLRLDLLAPAGSRLDELPAAVERPVLAERRRRTRGST